MIEAVRPFAVAVQVQLKNPYAEGELSYMASGVILHDRLTQQPYLMTAAHFGFVDIPADPDWEAKKLGRDLHVSSMVKWKSSCLLQVDTLKN